eukprot:4130154-Prymnesium_polylepis.1
MPARSNSCGVVPSSHEKKAPKSTARRSSFASTPGTAYTPTHARARQPSLSGACTRLATAEFTAQSRPA